jgi:hypothetical protein
MFPVNAYATFVCTVLKMNIFEEPDELGLQSA